MKSETKKVNPKIFVIGLVVLGALYGAFMIYSTYFAPPTLNYHGVPIAYHWHIPIDYREYGQKATLSPEIGLMNGVWADNYLNGQGPPDMSPIHTHNNDNLIHVEPLKYQIYTLGDLFKVMGKNPSDYKICSITPMTCIPILDVDEAQLADGSKYRIELK